MKAKLTALLLCFVLLASSLVACSKPAPTETPSASAPAPATQAPTPDESKAPETPDAQDVTTYTFLMAWNGGAAQFPDGYLDGAVAKAFEEKTGVRIQAETITSSEREKLAMVFASGDLPDITNAPHWSTNPGGEGELIKNAAVEGLLLPLNGLYEKYPNVVRSMTVGLSKSYLEEHVEHPDYNGEHYVIPTQTPGSNDDVTNWAYNLFARKDILEALNIKPEDVNTTEAIYDLLKKIKEGNFTDINGKPVIPGGTWHNGWDYNTFLRGFSDGGPTGWDMIGDEMVADVFNPLMEQKVLFMRKLVSEGLMDPECFTQTDTMGKEKHVTGRVAVFGCHYPHQYGFFASTLYVTNPEMEFVPLGPILNSKGEPTVGWSSVGRSGSPVLFFSKDIENPDKAMAFVDFINSEEGLLLTSFGIEGVHYNMVNGIPTLTEEWAEIKKTDPVRWYKEGFGIGDQFIGADTRTSRGWKPDYEEAGYKHAREIMPLEFYPGYNADNIANQWEGKPAYDEKMSTTNWGDELKKAFLAGSDAEALAIIEAQRKRMKDAGYDEMAKYVTDRIKADSSIAY